MIATAKQLQAHLSENPPREWENVSTKLLAELVAIATAARDAAKEWSTCLTYPRCENCSRCRIGSLTAAYFAPAPVPTK